MLNDYIVVMKSFILFLFFVSISFASIDSLRVPAPLPDSVVQEIRREQKVEQLNAQIAKMKKISECDKIGKSSAKEKQYCRARFQVLHPEIEEE